MFTQGWSVARQPGQAWGHKTFCTYLDHVPCLGSGTVGWGHALCVPCPFLGMGHQGMARVWGADISLRSEPWFGVPGGPRQSAVPQEQGLIVLCGSEVRLSQPPWLLLRWGRLRHRAGSGLQFTIQVMVLRLLVCFAGRKDFVLL